MRKTKEINSKGITLIALVITIIVMLILVGVTITMAVNGGLFEYARDAAQRTEEAKKLEQQLANENIVDEWLGKINGNEGNPNDTTITFYIDGSSYTIPKGLTWEDLETKAEYANYKPAGLSASEIVVRFEGRELYRNPQSGVTAKSFDKIENGHQYYSFYDWSSM